MPVTLRLEGADELERALLNSPAVLRTTQQQAMTRSLLLIEADARRGVRQDTRRLMNSITSRQRQSPRGLVGEVGPSARYGIHVERGTRPHWPPRAALEGWARRHGIPVFVVQRAIARRGTKARPFLLPAFRKNAEAIVRLFAAAGARAVATLGTGGRTGVSTVEQLAQGLKHRGETIPGLRCYAETHPKPEPPAMTVSGPIRWTYDETMDGYWRPVFECWVFVNPANLPLAQHALYAYLAPSGPQSIPAAIYGDPSLGGAASDTRVLGGSRPPSVVETAGGSLLGVALEVEVTAM